MTELTVLSLAEVQARLAKAEAARDAPARTAVNRTRWALRSAVALSDGFAVADLPQVGDEEDRANFVIADCERVVTTDGGRWRLRADVRTATLRRLGSAEQILAVAGRPLGGAADPVQQMAVRYLRARAPDLRSQSTPELAVTLRVIGWLAGTVDGPTLPTVDEVSTALDLTGLLAPLRSVADEHFIGRHEELDRLDHFLNGRRPRGPLTIDAAGGMGKSTLIAHFLLARIDRPSDAGEPWPFVYLTFDRAELRPDRPSSLLGDAARQLGLQNPALSSELAELRSACTGIEQFEIARSGESASSSRGSAAIGARATKDETVLIQRFGELTPPGQLWVLDTFEQAQGRGQTAMDRVREFTEQLANAVPGLRLVVAGRAPVQELAGGPRIELGGFDDATGRRFLAERLSGIRVPRGFLTEIARRARGIPLSLRLAADLIRRQGDRTRLTRDLMPELLADLEVEQIQGLLYRRTLDHISDPDVRRLANPGLVLRRITPEVIRQVLAEACGLGPIDEHRADVLFLALTAEVGLVEYAGPGVLIHRADVRRTVLPLLAADDPAGYRRINLAAVRYYADRKELEDRVEETYHRLLLAEPSSTLDEHWQPSVAQLLLPALDELPPASRAYLRTKLGLSATADELAAADEQAWLGQVVREARRLLDAGNPAEALHLIRSRQLAVRPVEVSLLETYALVASDDITGALAVAEQAIDVARSAGRPEDVVEIALIAGRISQDEDRLDRSLDLYTEADRAATSIGDLVLAISAAAGMLRVHRLAADADSPEVEELRKAVLEQYARLDAKQRLANPSLVRELAAELGSLDSSLLVDAVRQNGVDVVGEGAELLHSEGLGDHVRTVQDHLAPNSNVPMETLTSAEQGSDIADYLSNQPPDDELQNAISDIYRKEVDRKSFRYRK